MQVTTSIRALRMLRKDEGPFVLRSCHSAITRGKVLYIHEGGVKQSTGARTEDIVGVALEDGVAGQERYLQFHGWLNPSVANLGAGAACAVGVAADGSPVRADDVHCTSAPLWIGRCDADGNIFISANELATQPYLNVLDFGADPTGVLACDAAINAALRASQFGDIIYFPRGKYRMLATLNIETATGRVQPGITLRGAGMGVGDHGSELAFENASGDGIRAITDPTTNSHGYVTIENLLISQSNFANRSWVSEAGANGLTGGAAIGMIGGGFVKIRD